MSNIGTFTNGELTMTDERGSTTFEVGSVELHPLYALPQDIKPTPMTFEELMEVFRGTPVRGPVVSFDVFVSQGSRWESRRRRALRLARRIRRAKHGWR